MSENHGLILLETEMEDIIRVVEKMQNEQSYNVVHESMEANSYIYLSNGQIIPTTHNLVTLEHWVNLYSGGFIKVELSFAQRPNIREDTTRGFAWVNTAHITYITDTKL